MPVTAECRVAGRVLSPGAVQQDLFSAAHPMATVPSAARPWRTQLGGGAWVDVRRDWIAVPTGLVEHLVRSTAWRAERRSMYERTVDVPRLTCFVGPGEVPPHPAIADALAGANRCYAAEAGEPLVSVGLCLYRDGRDSVAWHGDTIGRGAVEDTVVAIVSLGACRRLLLRCRGGGPSWRVDLRHGDLLVMGGSCQRTWEHAVPKTARPVGARVSVQFRAAGVR